MDRELYKIAEHNIKVRKRMAWVAFFGVLLSLSFLLYSALIEDFQLWPFYCIVPIVIITLVYIFSQKKKIIGMKDQNPVLDEVQKLKDSGFSADELDTLELKEIVKEYRDDDLV